MGIMTKITTLKSLISICVLMIILSCSPKWAPTSNTPESNEPAFSGNMVEASVLQYVNEYRKRQGLSSLKPLLAASKQANEHSKDMALRKTGFGHQGFEQRMQNIKQSFGWITASAENVAYGQLTAKEVVKGWLNSPGHKKNIEGNYTDTGIGIYADKNGVLFFTQIFLRK